MVLLLCDSVEESVGHELDFLDAVVVAADLERVGRASAADEKRELAREWRAESVQSGFKCVPGRFGQVQVSFVQTARGELAGVE